MTLKGRNIQQYRAVAIGASAGGFEAMSEIFSVLRPDFKLPILIVQHLHSTDNGGYAQHLGRVSPLPVIEPCDKERIEPGRVYVAPANYHMAVERDGSIALSVDEKVNWSRPSIDVLFESAARVWSCGLIAIILSGANFDGAKGMLAVNEFGGTAVAQDPATADHPVMPKNAIETAGITKVLTPRQIGEFLLECNGLGSLIVDGTEPLVKRG